MTFSPVSAAHGCSYWTLRFYAILFKHLENAWRISFHFILSPKGHLELENSTPSLKFAWQQISPLLYVRAAVCILKHLATYFQIPFTSYGWLLRRLRRELSALLDWFDAYSANKERLCPSDNFMFGKMTWFFPPMTMLAIRNPGFWREVTSACGCRWEGWVHKNGCAL